MADHYVVLSSNGSMDHFPNNTLADFKVQLGKPIVLQGQYDVGLVEIIYPNKWFNVQESEAQIHISTVKKTRINLPKRPKNNTGVKPKPIKNNKEKTKSELKKWKQKKDEYERMVREHKKTITKDVGEEVANKLIKMKKQPNHYDKVTKGARNVTLEPGVYSGVAELEKNLKERLKKEEGLLLVERKESTGLFTITIKGDTKKVYLSPRMAELLGFPTTDKGYTLRESETAGVLPQLEGSAHSLYIYSSVVDHQLVGDTVAPLLRVVCPAGDKIGQKVSEKYIKPYYLPVNSSYMDHIDIQIRTTNGSYYPFLSGDPVVITLHFKPKNHG